MNHRLTRLLLAFIILTLAACNVAAPTQAPSPAAVSTSSPTPEDPLPSPFLTQEPTGTPPPVVEGDVLIWLDWPAEELQILARVVEQFQDAFPGVDISVAYFPEDEILERFIEASGEGTPPDVLIGPSTWTLDLWRQTLLRPIDARIDAEISDALLPLALHQASLGTTVVALPINLQGIVLYRNRDLVSTAPGTLAEMVEAGVNLQEQERNGTILDFGFLNTGSLFSTCAAELYTAGVELALSEADLTCWLETLLAWSEVGEIIVNGEEDLLAFTQGESAWLLEGSWQVDTVLESLTQEQIAIDPWPVYEVQGRALAGYSWTQNAFFSAASDAQDFDAAWIFVRYLLTEDVQRSFAQASAGRQFPVLASLTVEERWLDEMITALASNVPLPREPAFEIFRTQMDFEIGDVILRETAIDFSIRRVLDNLNRDLNQAQEEN